MEPTAPADTFFTGAGALSQRIRFGTKLKDYQLTAPMNTFKMNHKDPAHMTPGQLLCGPDCENPAQPVERFVYEEGELNTAADYVPPKYHKYFKQVEERIYGGPCEAPPATDIENGSGT